MNNKEKGFSRRQMLATAIGVGGIALSGTTGLVFAQSTKSVAIGKPFQLEGNRVAILRKGILEVKEGGLIAGFVTVADKVERFELKGSRIAILRGGVLEIKEGPVNAGFVKVADNVL